MRTNRKHRIAGALTGIIVMLGMAVLARADVQIGARIQIHPRPVDDLQITVWPDRGEGASYTIGDPISMNVEVSRDCFLILYNIDTRGNLRILFPYDPWDDNFAPAGDVIRFPRPQDGYDWTVDGPSGTEYVQAIATEFPVNPPDWPVYMRSVNHGGAVDLDPELRDFRAGNDRLDYIRVVNRKIVGRYWDWCATDLATFRVELPHYQHVNFDSDPWPDVFYGDIYINWPIGGRIFIDNVYIGIAPLWIPRHYYGHHAIICYEGARMVRRHEFDFYPKSECRYQVGPYHGADLRERGYVKSARRGGDVQFRDEIERYRMQKDSDHRKPSRPSNEERKVRDFRDNVKVQESGVERVRTDKAADPRLMPRYSRERASADVRSDQQVSRKEPKKNWLGQISESLANVARAKDKRPAREQAPAGERRMEKTKQENGGANAANVASTERAKEQEHARRGDSPKQSGDNGRRKRD